MKYENCVLVLLKARLKTFIAVIIIIKKIQSVQSKRFYDDEIRRKFWNNLSWLKQKKTRLH